MAEQLVIALESALSRCAAADIGSLSAAEVAVLVVDLRRVATRLEAEIARVVHVAAQAEVWRASGSTSMAAWLADETHVSMRSARDQVGLAATLAGAPLVAEKMAEGLLSVDNVRVLGGVAGEQRFEDDAELLVEIACGAPGDTRRALQRWLAMADPAGEAGRDERLRLKRHLTFTANGEGMFDVNGLLRECQMLCVRGLFCWCVMDVLMAVKWQPGLGRGSRWRIDARRVASRGSGMSISSRRCAAPATAV